MNSITAKVILFKDGVDHRTTYANIENNQIINAEPDITPEPIWFPETTDESIPVRVCINLNNVEIIDVRDDRDLSEYGFASINVDDYKRWCRL